MGYLPSVLVSWNILLRRKDGQVKYLQDVPGANRIKSHAGHKYILSLISVFCYPEKSPGNGHHMRLFYKFPEYKNCQSKAEFLQ